MAEQLRLDELFGYGSAVDGDEGLLCTRAAVVDRASGELLAGAALAQDEHSRRRGRYSVDQPVDFEHPGRVADDLAEALLREQHLLELPRSIEQAPVLGRLLDDVRHGVVRVERLGQEVVCARPHGGNRGVDVGERRHQHDLHRKPALLDGRQELETADAGHHDVDQSDVGRRAPDVLESLLAVLGDSHPHAARLEHSRQRRAEEPDHHLPGESKPVLRGRATRRIFVAREALPSWATRSIGVTSTAS